MKIILSRKGFDNSNGRIPSPILPCGRLLSLPIPVTQQDIANGEVGIPYADMRFDGRPISEIIEQLSNGQFQHEQAHLDPDLDRDRYENRGNGWRRTFGQEGNQWPAHLNNRGVGENDLFLFFGWFKQTNYENRILQYARSGKDLHVMFGWLQVGEIREVPNNQDLDNIPDWLHYHPHILNRGTYANNTIYIARDTLEIEGIDMNRRGGGTFPCFKSSLQLTATEGPMSRWCLPKWFYPTPPKRPLSCHDDIERMWEENDNYAFLQSVPRGQEFVLDTQYYPEAIGWLGNLFENCC